MAQYPSQPVLLGLSMSATTLEGLVGARGPRQVGGEGPVDRIDQQFNNCNMRQENDRSPPAAPGYITSNWAPIQLICCSILV
jgi:hypothetical protein